MTVAGARARLGGARTSGPGLAPVVALALVLGGSGLWLALYQRPGGLAEPGGLLHVPFWAGTHPGRAGLHLGLVRLLGWLHLAAGLALGVGLVRAWLVARRAGRGRAWLLGVLLWLGTLATGAAVPWQDGWPWSEAALRRAAPSTTLSGREGPFPELTGIRVYYPDGVQPARDRRALILAALHLGGPPCAGVVVLVGRRWLRRTGRGQVLGRRADRDVRGLALEAERDREQPGQG